VKDLNGDTRPDVAFTSYESNSLTTLVNTTAGLSAVTDNVPARPGRLTLASNPAGKSALFRFQLGSPGRLRLEIFDMNGRKVAVAHDMTLPAGQHEIAWTGDISAGGSAAPGAYFARLVGPDRRDTVKFIWLNR
jgi:flagellar hook assembly protein FlgD